MKDNEAVAKLAEELHLRLEAGVPALREAADWAYEVKRLTFCRPTANGVKAARVRAALGRKVAREYLDSLGSLVEELEELERQVNALEVER